MARQAGLVRRGDSASQAAWRMQVVFVRSLGEIAPEVADDLAQIDHDEAGSEALPSVVVMACSAEATVSPKRQLHWWRVRRKQETLLTNDGKGRAQERAKNVTAVGASVRRDNAVEVNSPIAIRLVDPIGLVCLEPKHSCVREHSLHCKSATRDTRALRQWEEVEGGADWPEYSSEHLKPHAGQPLSAGIGARPGARHFSGVRKVSGGATDKQDRPENQPANQWRTHGRTVAPFSWELQPRPQPCQ